MLPLYMLLRKLLYVYNYAHSPLHRACRFIIICKPATSFGHMGCAQQLQIFPAVFQPSQGTCWASCNVGDPLCKSLILEQLEHVTLLSSVHAYYCGTYSTGCGGQCRAIFRPTICLMLCNIVACMRRVVAQKSCEIHSIMTSQLQSQPSIMTGHCSDSSGSSL